VPDDYAELQKELVKLRAEASKRDALLDRLDRERDYAKNKDLIEMANVLRKERAVDRAKIDAILERLDRTSAAATVLFEAAEPPEKELARPLPETKGAEAELETEGEAGAELEVTPEEFEAEDESIVGEERQFKRGIDWEHFFGGGD
jgi:hypothetical protein